MIASMSKNSGGSFKTETPQESRPPIRRCAVYARVSTSNRGDDQLTALDAQIQSCKDYIKSQRGMDWELIEQSKFHSQIQINIHICVAKIFRTP